MEKQADAGDDARDAALWRQFAPQWARSLNRRAEVEQELFDASRGKRAMPTADELRAWAVKLGVPVELRLGVASQCAAKGRVLASSSIIGTVRFLRSEPQEHVCVCCPKGSGHIFNRRVDFSDYDWPGPHRDVQEFLYLAALRDASHEGKRVRVTVEVLQEEGQQPGAR